MEMGFDIGESTVGENVQKMLPFFYFIWSYFEIFHRGISVSNGGITVPSVARGFSSHAQFTKKISSLRLNVVLF